MLKLVKYLKGYIKESIIGPLFKLLEAIFELIVPLVMAKIIDVGIKNSDKAYILKMCGILVFLGVLGFICSITAQYFAAKAALGFSAALRRDLYKHINSFSYTELDKIGTSSLVVRLTGDVNQVQNGMNLILRLLLRSPFIVIGAVLMSFFINFKLTLIFVAVTILMSGIIYFIMSKSVPHYKRAQEKLDKITQITRDNLIGARVIRAFYMEDDEIKNFEDMSGSLLKTQTYVGRISSLLNPATYLILNLGIVLILYFGAFSVNIGTITQGELIALINYATQIILALLALSQLIIAITRAQSSSIRINEVFEIAPSMKNGEGVVIKDDGVKIEFKNVSFSYSDTAEEALSGISFSINKNETIGIIGGTGSGKSTLVNLICRFYDANSGEILIDGVDIKKFSFSQLREKISLVPQKASVFSGTIRENVKFGKDYVSDEEILKALEIAQLAEFVDSKEEGLDFMVLQGGKNLSGGQRQRLTIARALVGNPEIIILDDASSALDYQTDAKLRKALKELKDKTIIIVSQRCATVKNADKILVLDDGKLVGAGRHEELLKNCAEYQEIAKLQLGEGVLGNA